MMDSSVFCDKCNQEVLPNRSYAIGRRTEVPTEPMDVARLLCHDCFSSFFGKYATGIPITESLKDQCNRIALIHLRLTGRIRSEAYKLAHSEVFFVNMIQKFSSKGGLYTYEVFQAESKEKALSFLEMTEVNQDNYYIEVDTPYGTFGRDVLGVYGQ